MALVLVSSQNRRNSLVDEEELLVGEAELEEREVLRRDSNVKRIEAAFQSYQVRAADLMKETNQDFISQDAFKEICQEQYDRFMGCISLPYSLFVFFIFALSTYLHADVMTVYLVESVIGNHLGAGTPPVETVSDTWAWLEGTMLDSYFGPAGAPEQNWSQKETWKPVLTYNYLLGPIVMKQLRSERALCDQDVFNDMLCFKQTTRNTSAFGVDYAYNSTVSPDEYRSQQVSWQQRQDFWDASFVNLNARSDMGRRLRAVDGSLGELPPSASNQNGEIFATMLFPNTFRSTAAEQLAYLRNRGWLDQQSLSLKVQTVLLNGEVGRPRLTQVTYIFYFNRAGGIFTDVEVNTVFLKFWPGFMDISFGSDVIFVICLVVMTFVLLRSLRIRAMIRREHGVWKEFFSPWNMLQWSFVGFGWLCMVLHANAWSYTEILVPAYEAAVKAQVDDVPGELGIKVAHEMHTAVDNFVWFNSMTRVFFALYHVLLMVRFFTAFHAQPRLGVVTRTLEVSFMDILHFLVVLLPTFCSYAISGCFIFGKRVREFSNLMTSVGTCFRIFMESEYDWITLSEEDFLTPFVWVLSFMVLMVMIMLNMVLAIILDVYTEIRKKSGHAETVWVTGYHMFQQLWHFKHWIASQDLIAKADEMPAQIGRADVLRIFPTMCEEQVEQLFAAARYWHISCEQGNEQDARKLALSVKLVMDNINTTLTQLDQGTCENSKLTSHNAQGWLPDLAHEMAIQNHQMLALQWHLQQIEWQWQALETIHGQEANFSGQHKVPAEKKELPL